MVLHVYVKYSYIYSGCVRLNLFFLLVSFWVTLARHRDMRSSYPFETWFHDIPTVF